VNIKIAADRPLAVANALENDQLNRCGFAKAAVLALERVSNDTGFVISIEGSWGSGKTSILAMMEQIIQQRSVGPTPIVVHFNPWLIGDRSALLRQFLMSISNALSMKDNADEAEKAAKALKNYAKVFDFIAYIPGAEPFTSPVKKVLNAASNAVGGVADEKKRDLEAKKSQLEQALIALGRKIYVFIDDIDRLYPNEVYEMVRIVKAVGDLPNVGYILAMDSSYVASALESANVPQSLTFMDKIVQIRLPIPAISIKTRNDLLNQRLKSLSSEVFKPYFENQNERLSMIYFHGIRDLLEHPRDIVRVINTLSVIEPSLRGEVVFGDIFALATLMVKAPNVHNELKRNPGIFTGESIRGIGDDARKKEILDAEVKINEICQASSSPAAVKSLLTFMFPKTFNNSYSNISSVEGHIAAPDRLAIAIGQTVGSHDVSLVSARKYLLEPEHRALIILSLNKENSLDFVERVGDISQKIDAEQLTDVEHIATELASLIDSLSMDGRLPERLFFGIDPENYVRHAIRKIVETKCHGDEVASRRMMMILADLIASDRRAISMAAEILFSSHYTDSRIRLAVDRNSIQKLSDQLAENVVHSVDAGEFWRLVNPARVIWYLMRHVKHYFADVLEAFKRNDPTLDAFALHFLRSGISSDGGQSYNLPKEDEILAAIDVDWLKIHAQARLDDKGIGKVVRNAWRSVVEGKSIYGESGRDAGD
jgi:KAP family P-loop domain